MDTIIENSAEKKIIENREYISAKEAAAMLGVSVKRIYFLVEKGTLSAIPPQEMMIDCSSLGEYAENRKAGRHAKGN